MIAPRWCPRPASSSHAGVKDLYDRVRRRPAQSLLVAVGTGYLLGGGLGTILTARLLALGSRMALRLAVVPILAGEVERILFGGGEDVPADAKAPAPKRLIQEKEIET